MLDMPALPLAIFMMKPKPAIFATYATPPCWLLIRHFQMPDAAQPGDAAEITLVLFSPLLSALISIATLIRGCYAAITPPRQMPPLFRHAAAAMSPIRLMPTLIQMSRRVTFISYDYAYAAC